MAVLLRLVLATIIGLLLFGSQSVAQATTTSISYLSPRPFTSDVSARTSIAIRADSAPLPSTLTALPSASRPYMVQVVSAPSRPTPTSPL